MVYGTAVSWQSADDPDGEEDGEEDEASDGEDDDSEGEDGLELLLHRPQVVWQKLPLVSHSSLHCGGVVKDLCESMYSGKVGLVHMASPLLAHSSV